MINYMTIGGITLDDTVFQYGKTVFDAPGGNGIYSALGARIWSEGVGIVSRIGSDYPQKNLETLENSGVDIRGIQQVDFPSQHLWLLYEQNGSRQFIFHSTSGTPDSEIDPIPSQIPQDYLDARMAHLSAMGFDSQHAIASFLHEKGTVYSYDVTQASLMMESRQYADNFATTNSKLFLPSIEEVEAIYGKKALLPLLAKIAHYGPQYFAVKMGAEGSVVYDAQKEQAIRIPIFPVEVCDPTGAGDAYCGGFMVGFCETGSVLEAGLYGTVSASFAIQEVGSFHLLQVGKKEAIKRINYLRKNVEFLNSK